MRTKQAYIFSNILRREKNECSTFGLLKILFANKSQKTK